MIKKFFLQFMPLFLCFSCSKKYTHDNLPLKNIQFGTSGGFTGKKTNYLLLENGQLFLQKDFDGKEFTEIGKIKAKIANEFFKKASEFNQVEINRPGNFNHFLMVKNERGEAQSWQWSQDLKTKDSTVNQLFLLHKNLLKTIPIADTSSNNKQVPKDHKE